MKVPRTPFPAKAVLVLLLRATLARGAQDAHGHGSRFIRREYQEPARRVDAKRHEVADAMLQGALFYQGNVEKLTDVDHHAKKRKSADKVAQVRRHAAAGKAAPQGQPAQAAAQKQADNATDSQQNLGKSATGSSEKEAASQKQASNATDSQQNPVNSSGEEAAFHKQTDNATDSHQNLMKSAAGSSVKEATSQKQASNATDGQQNLEKTIPGPSEKEEESSEAKCASPELDMVETPQLYRKGPDCTPAHCFTGKHDRNYTGVRVLWSKIFDSDGQTVALRPMVSRTTCYPLEDGFAMSVMEVPVQCRTEAGAQVKDAWRCQQCSPGKFWTEKGCETCTGIVDTMDRLDGTGSVCRVDNSCPAGTELFKNKKSARFLANESYCRECKSDHGWNPASGSCEHCSAGTVPDDDAAAKEASFVAAYAGILDTQVLHPGARIGKTYYFNSRPYCFMLVVGGRLYSRYLPEVEGHSACSSQFDVPDGGELDGVIMGRYVHTFENGTMLYARDFNDYLKPQPKCPHGSWAYITLQAQSGADLDEIDSVKIVDNTSQLCFGNFELSMTREFRTCSRGILKTMLPQQRREQAGPEAESAPAESAPAKAVPARAAPAKIAPAKIAPAKIAPADTAPAAVRKAAATSIWISMRQAALNKSAADMKALRHLHCSHHTSVECTSHRDCRNKLKTFNDSGTVRAMARCDFKEGVDKHYCKCKTSRNSCPGAHNNTCEIVSPATSPFLWVSAKVCLAPNATGCHKSGVRVRSSDMAPVAVPAAEDCKRVSCALWVRFNRANIEHGVAWPTGNKVTPWQSRKANKWYRISPRHHVGDPWKTSRWAFAPRWNGLGGGPPKQSPTLYTLTASHERGPELAR